MIAYQHGDSRVVDDYSFLPLATQTIDLEYKHDKDVYVESINALKIGEAAMLLGAGRATLEDKIDFAVGVVLHKKVGNKITKGDVLATV